MNQNKYLQNAQNKNILVEMTKFYIKSNDILVNFKKSKRINKIEWISQKRCDTEMNNEDNKKEIKKILFFFEDLIR